MGNPEEETFWGVCVDMASSPTHVNCFEGEWMGEGVKERTKGMRISVLSGEDL